jgi:transposase
MTDGLSQRRIDARTPQEQLPAEVPVLQQMVLTLLADVDDLRRQLLWFQNHVFGRRSEKLDPHQAWLFKALGQATGQAAVADPDPTSTPAEPKATVSNHKGRKALPANLPRQRIEHHPDPDELTCDQCGQAKQRIGEEITEQLDYVPSSFVVLQHVRVKYACKSCEEGVVIGELPAMPIEKGRPGEGLLAHVLTSKYADHLPLHRLEGIFERYGVQISRSTLCDWVGQGADLLEPIVVEMKRQILLSRKIHTDDTPVKVQEEDKKGGGKGPCRKGYLWAYIGMANDVVFDYTPGHSREGPVAFLGDYSGYLQADAYKGYDAVFAKGKAVEVACWAHTRRKFWDARGSDALRSARMLVEIQKLYEIEHQAREQGLLPDQIRDLRQKKAKPILEQIEALLKAWTQEVLPQSPISDAIGYARGQWAALNRYIEDGILSADNNLAERVLRTVAVGRNNWLFFGADSGGHRAAIVYSLVASCRLCKKDPFAYLRDALKRINTHPASRISELTPANWLPPVD